MSTRCEIGIISRDKNVKVSYCHHDGYLEYTGKILNKHYQDVKTIEKLISKGDMSVLESTIEESRFYNGGSARSEMPLKEYIDDVSNDCFIEYVYLYDKKEKCWIVSMRDGIFYKLDKMLNAEFNEDKCEYVYPERYNLF